MATYSIFQRLVHEIVTSTETDRTVSSTGVQPKNNVPIDTSTESSPETDRKPINRLQTVCQITEYDIKKLKLHQ